MLLLWLRGRCGSYELIFVLFWSALISLPRASYFQSSFTSLDQLANLNSLFAKVQDEQIRDWGGRIRYTVGETTENKLNLYRLAALILWEGCPDGVRWSAEMFSVICNNSTALKTMCNTSRRVFNQWKIDFTISRDNCITSRNVSERLVIGEENAK